MNSELVRHHRERMVKSSLNSENHNIHYSIESWNIRDGCLTGRQKTSLNKHTRTTGDDELRSKNELISRKSSKNVLEIWFNHWHLITAASQGVQWPTRPLTRARWPSDYFVLQGGRKRTTFLAALLTSCKRKAQECEVCVLSLKLCTH